MSILDPWTTLESKTLLKLPLLAVSQEKVELQDGRIIEDYYQIAMGRAAVIAATRTDGRMILLRLYKHGARRSGLGFPGGGVEDGETGLDAAKRELREETGYATDQWQELGSYPVHSNQGCGNVSFFAAFGCRKVADPVADDLEAHEFVYATPDEVRSALLNQEFLSMGHVCMAGLWAAAMAARED